MAKVTPWPDPGLPDAVEYDSDEFERIRRRAIDGLLSLPRVGMGVGGLLLGTRDSGVIRIISSQEISCAHAFGPGFRLTDAEIAAALEAAPRPDGMQVVGWYCSKPRGAPELTAEDEQLFDALCPLPWQIALLILPSTVDVTRAAVRTRTNRGTLLPLPKTEPTVDEVIPEKTAPAARPTPPEPPTARPEPLFAVPPPRRRVSRLPRWAAVAALCSLSALGVFASRGLWWPKPKLELRSFDSGDALTIEWNSSAVRGMDNGYLEIQDGGESQIYLLSASQLRAGTVSYPRRTGKVSAILRAGDIEEAVTFTGPPPPIMKR
ncbi:MAG TPA: hypothetical protein VKB79_03400 [Bryobacteraceae bacterium]|nr:hypothetical protein [Bryobacteraceae bacterium]